MALVATLGLATDADAQERVRWKMQSAFPGNLSHLGTSAIRLEGMVERVSGGNFELKFFEPGALVPALECFDAAAKGSVESCFTTAGYHTGKHPSLAFFTAVPFGPELRRILRLDDLWRRQGLAERDLCPKRPVLARLQHDRPRDLGLVP